METLQCPPLSELFEAEVRQKHIQHRFDPEKGLTFVQGFLKKYPCYPEALLFQARMLLAQGKLHDALSILENAKKVDKWRMSYAFDEAESLYKLGRKSEALQIIHFAIEHLLREALDGLENFLIGIDFVDVEREQVLAMMCKEMVPFIIKESTTLNFEQIIPILQEHSIDQRDADE